MTDTRRKYRDFDALLKEAAERPITREERREQRISWAIGMLPPNVKMTREEIERLVDEKYG